MLSLSNFLFVEDYFSEEGQAKLSLLRTVEECCSIFSLAGMSYHSIEPRFQRTEGDLRKGRYCCQVDKEVIALNGEKEERALDKLGAALNSKEVDDQVSEFLLGHLNQAALLTCVLPITMTLTSLMLSADFLTQINIVPTQKSEVDGRRKGVTLELIYSVRKGQLASYSWAFFPDSKDMSLVLTKVDITGFKNYLDTCLKKDRRAASSLMQVQKDIEKLVYSFGESWLSEHVKQSKWLKSDFDQLVSKNHIVALRERLRASDLGENTEIKIHERNLEHLKQKSCDRGKASAVARPEQQKEGGYESAPDQEKTKERSIRCESGKVQGRVARAVFGSLVTDDVQVIYGLENNISVLDAFNNYINDIDQFSKSSTREICEKYKEWASFVDDSELYKELMNKWLCMRVGSLFAGYFRQDTKKQGLFSMGQSCHLQKVMVGVSAGLGHVFRLIDECPDDYEHIMKGIAGVIKQKIENDALAEIVNQAVNVPAVADNKALKLFLLELHPEFEPEEDAVKMSCS